GSVVFGLLVLVFGMGGCDSVGETFSKQMVAHTLNTGAVKVNQIDQGQYGDIVDGTKRVLRDEEAYASFWKTLHADQESVPDRPKVDFSERVVVAIVLGRRPTGGYTVGVDEVLASEDGEKIRVRFTETVPGENCIVTQALTSPYVLVSVEAREESFTFEGTKTTRSC
ncbi:MAG: protease complex subunit PrcB family protein, partial [Salinibacter sp.]